MIGVFCLSYSILFILALIFAWVLCRAAAEADADAMRLSASRHPPPNSKPHI